MLVGSAVLVLGGGDDGDVGTSPTSTSSDSASTPSTTGDGDFSEATAPSASTEPGTAATTARGSVPTQPDNTVPGRDREPPAPTGPVPTHRVAGVAVDDVLNVRHGPDPGADILAGLAPAYAGVAWTGEEAISPDGGTWWRVELLDPVRLSGLLEPLHGGRPIGWVNSAFLEPISDGLPVDFARLACDAGGAIGIFQTEPEGAGTWSADHVYSMRHGVSGDCNRLVITLGSGFTPGLVEDITTDIRPADEIPVTGLANEERMTISWDELAGTREEAMQLATPHGPILVVLDEFGTFAVVFTYPVTGPRYRAFPDEGRIVLDYEPFGEPTSNTFGRLVVAPPPVIIEPNDVIAEPVVWVEGWARPFEATLQIGLTRSGSAVQADFRGSNILGDVTGSDYAVMTSAWAEAWGHFVFQIEGLDPGDYEVSLTSEGGASIGIRVPFTLP